MFSSQIIDQNWFSVELLEIFSQLTQLEILIVHGRYYEKKKIFDGNIFKIYFIAWNIFCQPWYPPDVGSSEREELIIYTLSAGLA